MTNLTFRQHKYLKTMDIDVWVPRRIAAVSGVDAVVQAEAALVAEAVPEPQPEPEIPAWVTEPTSQLEPVIVENDLASLDWDALQARVAQCQLCELHQSRSQTVFGVGNRKADWLIIGEAPGAEEDRQGEPFVGRAGQLLNAMLQAVGLSRQQVYIANILKCRPPDNRDPQPEEAVACVPYLQRQIELIQPKIILALGRIAAQRLLQTNSTLGRLRGKVHHLDTTLAPVIVTYHPAYLLRSPLEKRKAWEDLLFAVETMQERS